MAHARAGAPAPGPPVKHVAALLLSRGIEADRVIAGGLDRLAGPVDYRGPERPFEETDYYEREMGPGLRRLFVSFEPLGEATSLVRIKLAAARLEAGFSEGGRRRVNIDPGYIDYFKLVLASFKEGPQKIYLGEGVWADPVLLFGDGAWRPLPWSF
ncbi:MAG: DUF4416 family protein, partial [Candidatus Krumholzibacteria bacterium]|nr:DUF4416 family protein [Candidatus Krumholzibacteria bacterium]